MDGLIPEVQTVLQGGNEIINPQVAELETQEDIEDKPFVISFKEYRGDLCGLDSLNKKNTKHALLVLKEIGVSVFRIEDIMKLDFRTSHVVDSGDYSKLYNGLRDREDIELREIYLVDRERNTGRIFYFTNIPSKIMYLVAITESHFDTSKNNRR